MLLIENVLDALAECVEDISDDVKIRHQGSVEEAVSASHKVPAKPEVGDDGKRDVFAVEHSHVVHTHDQTGKQTKFVVRTDPQYGSAIYPIGERKKALARGDLDNDTDRLHPEDKKKHGDSGPGSHTWAHLDSARAFARGLAGRKRSKFYGRGNAKWAHAAGTAARSGIHGGSAPGEEDMSDTRERDVASYVKKHGAY